MMSLLNAELLGLAIVGALATVVGPWFVKPLFALGTLACLVTLGKIGYDAWRKP